ncbi:MAG: hypothetical protein HY590_03370 [Candidatus Omnitrophica bacterium]|nr:hypothetical protein [Candidatus Omnitrophota bacterium]
MPSFSLEIGGIGFHIEWENSHPRDFPFRYDLFPLRGKPRVHLTVHCENGFPDFLKERVLFELKDHWALYESDGHYWIETFHSKTKQRQFLAHLTKDFSEGEVYAAPGWVSGPLHRLFPPIKPRWPFTEFMKPLGQILLVHLLSQGEGVVVHGLGIREGGEGRAFVGPSGSGKSTLAHLFLGTGGVSILSDETVIIRKDGASFFLHGTPWPGDTFRISQESAPLRGLFFLQHASQNSLKPLSLSDFPEVLLPQLFLPHWDGGRIQKALAFCEELFSSVPCYQFGFVKEQSAISFLKEAARPDEAYALARS